MYDGRFTMENDIGQDVYEAEMRLRMYENLSNRELSACERETLWKGSPIETECKPHSNLTKWVLC